MGKVKSDAPDYQAAAAQEGEAAKDITRTQTYANRPTQINPWGRIDWQASAGVDPATGKPVTEWEQTQTLDPGLQQALNSQIALMSGRSALGAGMMGDLASTMGPGMDWSQFAPLTNVTAPDAIGTAGTAPRVSDLGTTEYTPADYSGASAVDRPEFTNQRAEESIYQRQADRLNQQFAGEEDALRIRMRNQGLAPGDQAWESQMAQLNQRRNDAFQGASTSAIQFGGQEAQRMFDMQQAQRAQQTGEADRQFGMMSSAQQQAFQDRLAAGNFQNQARREAINEMMGLGQYNQAQAYQFADYQNQLRQQAMNEALMQRSQRLNEVNALIGGQQVGQPQFNPFIGAQAAQTPPILQGAIAQGQQAAADASVSNQAFSNLLGGAVGLGTAGMMGGYF